MTVVVGMLTHRDPPQIDRLIRRVTAADDVVVVLHHDPTGPELDLRGHDRVFPVPGAAPAPWGSMGVAAAQLRTLEFALETVPDLSWFLLISGADYPIRSLNDIRSELAGLDGDALVRWYRLQGDPRDDVHHWQATTRRRYTRRLRVRGLSRAIPFPRRTPFRGGTELYAGGLWVNLNRAASLHVIEQYQRRPDIVRHFSRAPVPDEGLLPTLLLNDRGGLNVIPDARRFIRWTPGSRHPDLLSGADVPQILASGAYFARKVDRTFDESVMDGLDEAIGYR